MFVIIHLDPWPIQILGLIQFNEIDVGYVQKNKFLTVLYLFHQDSPKSGRWASGAEMTEEEALAEQQRMFAEARARMNNGNANPPRQSDSD